MKGIISFLKEIDFNKAIAALGVILILFIIGLTVLSNQAYNRKIKNERKEELKTQIEFLSSNSPSGIGVVDVDEFSTQEDFLDAAENAKESDSVEIIPSGEDIRNWNPELTQEYGNTYLTDEQIWDNIFESGDISNFVD